MGNRKADLEAANEAVRAAAVSCRAVQERLVKPETLEKKDKSPVTVADFASQAIVCSMLAQRFPGDPVVGEENAAELREEAQAPLRDVVVERVRGELETDASADQVLEWIDLGAADASADRYWTLDPIDGTKGFLRGEQYAVALGLIEKGRVVLGVLGCPNLPLDGGKGALFFASEGGPAYVQPLFGSGEAREVSVGSLTKASEARFCESVESGHSNQDESAKIVSLLGIQTEPFRIDSQCKYAAVARNDASIYLRMPTRKDYQEKIWDHAAGSIIVEAAGGRVTDINGLDLDFTHGRTLDANSGVVATSGAIHDEVIDAVCRARG
jgi:3'(2'), 5'-bisphosphate nucleotidase